MKGPLTMTDGGPARPRQLGKTECQEQVINISADGWLKEENGGIDQTGESVRLRWADLGGGRFENMFFPPSRL